MHRNVKVGDEMTLTYPVNLFSLDLRAKKHVFLAGGIGITPFKAMIAQLERLNGNWELHYACRSEALATYAADLSEHYPNNVHIYYDNQKQAIDLDGLLAGQPLGTHIYICGPAGMIKWVHNTAEAAGWPADNVHSEEFLAPQPGKPFQVRLCKSDKVIEVGEHESLLEAIERAGVEAPFLCRGGACGQCETDVVEFDGEFIHRDHWLEPDEHASGKKIMPCVSRFVGKTLVLDR
jgi:ferredoxin-NADP reductase